MKYSLSLLSICIVSFIIVFSCSTEDEESVAPVVQTPQPEPEPVEYTLSVSAAEGGTVSTEGGTYDEGSEVTITATANEGYRFTGWEANNSTNESLTITLNSDQTLQALFELIPIYTLTITTSEGGTVSSEGGEYEEGTEIEITATANEGFIFSHWSNDSEDKNLKFSMNESDVELIAFFTSDFSIEDGIYKVYDAEGGQPEWFMQNGYEWYLEFRDGEVFTALMKGSFDVGGSIGERLEEKTGYCTGCGRENSYGGWLGSWEDSLNKITRSKLNYTHIRSFEGDTTKYSIDAVKTDEINGIDFFWDNNIPISRDEIQRRFRERGKGFYADPVYKNIDFDRPYSIVEAFVSDAARNNVDLSYALSQEFIFSVGLDVVQDLFGVHDFTYDAVALGPCNDSLIHINYYSYFENKILTENGWGDLLVFYHELGHDILNLEHNCFSGGGMTDIMSFGFDCMNISQPSEVPIGYFENDVDNSVEYFRNIARRMFQEIDQITYNCN